MVAALLVVRHYGFGALLLRCILSREFATPRKTMRHLIPVDGVQIACDDTQSGTAKTAREWPVILLHAFPLTSEMWDETAEQLSGEFRVLRPTWRGFFVPGGPNPSQPEALTPARSHQPTTTERLARDVIAVCEHLGVRAAVFVGLSLGGYTMFPLIRLRPDLVRAAVFCDTRPEADTAEGRQNRMKMNELLLGNDAAHRKAEFTDRMLQRLLGATTRERRPDVVERVRKWVLAAPNDAIIRANLGMAERPDSNSMLAGIRVPAKVMVGEEDALIPVEDARSFASNIKGASLATIPAAGHLANLENPSVFDRELRSFLQQVY